MVEMAAAAKRSSANTSLYVGTLKMDIGLFGTEAKPGKEQDFDTAGPNGGVLKFELRGQAAPVENEVPVEAPAPAGVSDPLDELRAAVPTPAVEATTDAAAEMSIERDRDGAIGMPTEPAGSVPGEFSRVLVEDGSGEVVKPEALRRGVRLGDGRFIDLTEQVEAITERTKLDRIEVVATIESTSIRRERVIGSYYVGAQAAPDVVKLRWLYDGLKARREVAVVKYTTRSRQNLGVLVPHAKTGTLVLLSLVFSEDFREAPARARAIAEVEVNPAHVSMMETLLGSMRQPVHVLDELRDDAIALREELRLRAEAGEMDISIVEPLAVADEQEDLTDALAASLAHVREKAVGRV
jgi:non-homologous end joining protein Ku